jgi:hypothetical protein
MGYFGQCKRGNVPRNPAWTHVAFWWLNSGWDGERSVVASVKKGRGGVIGSANNRRWQRAQPAGSFHACRMERIGGGPLDGHRRRGVGADTGMPQQTLGVYVAHQTNPHSYATLPKVQDAIARLTWNHGLRRIVREFRKNRGLRAMLTDQVTAVVREISQTGVITPCVVCKGNPMVARSTRRQARNGRPR